jgi:PD-(D/E)XK nuclease superfamily
LQLGIYALAAREDLEVEPARLIYYNLETNECVAAARDAKQIEEMRGTIQEVAGDIRAREFPALPGFQCRSCEYRFICPAQEPRRGPADLDAAPEPVPTTATSGTNSASTSRTTSKKEIREPLLF